MTLEQLIHEVAKALTNPNSLETAKTIARETKQKTVPAFIVVADANGDLHAVETAIRRDYRKEREWRISRDTSLQLDELYPLSSKRSRFGVDAPN